MYKGNISEQASILVLLAVGQVDLLDIDIQITGTKITPRKLTLLFKCLPVITLRRVELYNRYFILGPTVCGQLLTVISQVVVVLHIVFVFFL